jgi:hypothetical protein
VETLPAQQPVVRAELFSATHGTEEISAAMSQPTASNSSARSRWWIFAALILLMASLALTTRSFWLDETYSARFAEQPTPSACWHLLREIRGSDPQMPLYIAWLWAVEKVVGHQEIALRGVNLFWFVPALLVLSRTLAGNRALQLGCFGVAIASPFAWYYLNEARAYTMQFSTSLMLFAIIGHWARQTDFSATKERSKVWLFCVALFCLCGSSLLSMVLATVPLLSLLFLVPLKSLRQLGKQCCFSLTTTLTALIALGIYYLWTLHSGDRATGIAGTDWRNAAFIAYELFGFIGLGPGRMAIRSGGGGLEIFRAFAPVLLLFAIILVALLIFALKDLRTRLGTKKMALLFLAVALPVGLLLAASHAMHFRILGRHFAAMWPVAVLLLGLGLATAWRRGKLGKVLACSFVGLYLASAVSLRFAVRHEKDDYRGAANLAKAALAEGKSVWWNADRNSALFYQVPLATGNLSTNFAIWLANPDAQSFAGSQPDVIIATRPDAYDESGYIRELAQRSHYQLSTNLTAFQVWRRSKADTTPSQSK